MHVIRFLSMNIYRFKIIDILTKSWMDCVKQDINMKIVNSENYKDECMEKTYCADFA